MAGFPKFWGGAEPTPSTEPQPDPGEHLRRHGERDPGLHINVISQQHRSAAVIVERVSCRAHLTVHLLLRLHVHYMRRRYREFRRRVGLQAGTFVSAAGISYR